MRTVDPYTRDRPEPLEILARMAGRTNLVVPDVRSASVSVTPIDIAHALGTAPDKLGAAMAMAMACQRASEWETVSLLGRSRLVASIEHRHKAAVTGTNSYRLWILLYDAFALLVAPQVSASVGAAARFARLRRGQFVELRSVALAMLEAAANTAAADAVRYLFSLAVDGPKRRDDDNPSAPQSDAMTIASKPSRRLQDDDIEALCADVIRRPRTAGILTFARMRPAFDSTPSLA